MFELQHEVVGRQGILPRGADVDRRQVRGSVVGVEVGSGRVQIENRE